MRNWNQMERVWEGQRENKTLNSKFMALFKTRRGICSGDESCKYAFNSPRNRWVLSKLLHERIFKQVPDLFPERPGISLRTYKLRGRTSYDPNRIEQLGMCIRILIRRALKGDPLSFRFTQRIFPFNRMRESIVTLAWQRSHQVL